MLLKKSIATTLQSSYKNLKEKFPSQKFEHLVARFFEKRIAGVFVKKSKLVSW